MSDEHEDHGHSVAAWTGVFSLIAASALISVGVGLGPAIWTIIGIVVGVVGLIAAIALSKAGFGSQTKRASLLGEAATETADSEGQTGIR